jgi:trigger factor
MAIKANVKTRTPCEVILEADVPGPDLEAAYERTFRKLYKYVALPGFRAGKAPRDMVEQRFKNEIKTQTIEDLMVAVVRSVIKQHHLYPVTGPRAAEQPEYPDTGGELSFTVEFEVAPAVKLDDYKGLALTKRKVEISDEDVDRIVEQLLEQHATFEEPEEERPAAFGDWVIIDYTGKVMGQEVMKRDDAWVEVSATARLPVPGFGEQLAGLKPNESQEITATAPTDFSNKELAGKEITFNVRVKKVQERRTPELTDELVQKIDPNCKTVDDLRKAIQENQLQYRDNEEQRRLRELAREALVRRHPLPLPPSFLHSRTRRLMEEEIRGRLQRGESEEQLKEQVDELQKEMQQRAEFLLRAEYILDAIAKAEKLEVTEDDIMPQLQYYASAFRKDVGWVRAMMEREGHLDNLYATAREEKALDVVVDAAKITEK